jgi:hypothetical protein
MNFIYFSLLLVLLSLLTIDAQSQTVPIASSCRDFLASHEQGAGGWSYGYKQNNTNNVEMAPYKLLSNDSGTDWFWYYNVVQRAHSGKFEQLPWANGKIPFVFI